MNKNRRWLIGVSTLLAVLVGFVLVAIQKRQSILLRAERKIIEKQKAENGLNVVFGQSNFKGLNTISFRNITVVPEKGDSLLKIESIEIRIQALPLLFGKVKADGLMLSGGWIHLSKRRGVSNYAFLLKKKSRDPSSKNNGYAALVDQVVNNTLYKIPPQLAISSFYIRKQDDSSTVQLAVKTASITNHRLRSSIRWSEENKDWHLNGFIDAADNHLDFKLFTDKGKFDVPYLRKRYHLNIGFDTLYTALKDVKNIGESLFMRGAWGIKGLVLRQEKIAPDDIVVPSASIDASLRFGKNDVTLDSASIIHIKKLVIHPFVRFVSKPSRIYALSLHIPLLPAQEFFDAFPQGLFSSLSGIKVAGQLGYRMRFYLDEKDPDALEFNAGFEKQRFKIIGYGGTDLNKINGPFTYVPYEKGRPMRSRYIGPSNPNYTPLSQVSPFLRNAVVASEDPNFYAHKGIDEYAFRKVMVIDYKAKSFKRGGSTLSMQLVKNVFLSRQKTVSRKMEEMLITWLLENAGIVSKQRILEVYLNIIEWAPNVYGVGEASRYYFGKPPSSLTLGESIFMTSVIPKPKAYRYSFTPDGSLKSYIKGYYRFISNALIARGKITDSDTTAMFHIVLRGPAARNVIKYAPVPVDSIKIDSLNLFDRNLN